jgi:serine/threonine protein kinase
LENSSQIQKNWDELQGAIAFLQSKGIIHFDLHFGNILTDGEQIYLTDFGLVLDRSFALSSEEMSFLEENRFYDYGEVLRNLGHLIRGWYNSCSQEDKFRIIEKYGIDQSWESYRLGKVLLDNIEGIYADGDINLALDKFYVDSIVKYRSIITLIQNFFVEIRRNNRKDTQFPDLELRLLLKDTGFI